MMKNYLLYSPYLKNTWEFITGLTQKEPKVGVIHELPLRKNKVFSHILRKSYNCKVGFVCVDGIYKIG